MRLYLGLAAFPPTGSLATWGLRRDSLRSPTCTYEPPVLPDPCDKGQPFEAATWGGLKKRIFSYARRYPDERFEAVLKRPFCRMRLADARSSEAQWSRNSQFDVGPRTQPVTSGLKARCYLS
jgi:hypothetical protein